jgi:hypothetical protein
MVTGTAPFKYKFFIRIAKDFPLLKNFLIINFMSPFEDFGHYKADNIYFYSPIKYPHLTSLDIMYVDDNYIEQFLLDTKTYAAHLNGIKVHYDQLKTVTENFTRDATVLI